MSHLRAYDNTLSCCTLDMERGIGFCVRPLLFPNGGREVYAAFFFRDFFASLSSSASTTSAMRPNTGSDLSMPRIAGPTTAAAVAKPRALISVTPAR